MTSFRSSTRLSFTRDSFALEDTHEVLRETVLVRQKKHWTRKFVVLDVDSLYYFKTSASAKPKFFLPLEGCTLYDTSTDSSPCALLLQKGTTLLELRLSTLAAFNHWFHLLTLRVALPLYPLSKREKDFIESELLSKVPLQNTSAEKSVEIRKFTELDYTLAGSRGQSCYYVSTPECTLPPTRFFPWQTVKIFAFFALLLAFFTPELGSALLLGCLTLTAYRSKDSLPKNIHFFKTVARIKRSPPEILVALQQFDTRCEWEPYLTIGPESTLHYPNSQQILLQTFIKDSFCFYVLEKTGSLVKNVFKLEEKSFGQTNFTRVTHFGKSLGTFDPAIGNPDILACFKYYLESRPLILSDGQTEASSEEEIGQLAQWNKTFRKLKQEVLKLTQASDWLMFRVKEKNLECFIRGGPGGLSQLKAHVQLNAEMTRVLNYLSDCRNRCVFDPLCESAYTIDSYSDTMEVNCIVTSPLHDGKARDFCVLQKQEWIDSETCLLMNFSVDHPLAPTSNRVRAEIYFECFLVEHLNVHTVEITYIADTNLEVPETKTKKLRQQQALIMANLQSILSK